MKLVTNSVILVVEDDEGLRNIISKSLRQKGYEVLTATQGEEAFEIVKANRDIDFVLSDIRMPGGNGMELLKKIKAEILNPPIVILMTGFTDVVFSVAIAAGAHSIITKPFSIQSLIDHIEDVETESPHRRLIVF